jgi:Zn-dependent protease with chaperone function
MVSSVVARSSASERYSFSGTFEPTRLSWAYRAGLVIVTAAMLILPLVYLGLIVAAGSAVWWHLTEHTWIVTERTSGGIWRLLAYLGPAVTGCVFVFFMIKPVLARPARRADPIAIPPDSEPDLVPFVARICEQVRAPVPERILVDCQVNASAGFVSILPLRPRFVLTIGLPLAGGLTIRQLAGVLAHEFGHFAQGGGMRLTFLVRSINGWFARVAFERDQWDDKLEHWTKQGDWRLGIFLLMAQGSVWVSRRILYGLMMAGHGISCFMLRQMEYDADSYEIKLVGTAAFIETFSRLRELNVGAHLGYREVQEGWVRRTLPSNLPAFLLDRCGRLPQELLTQIRQVSEGKTGFFATHPTDADRLRAATVASTNGVLEGGDVPATLLFRNYETLSAAATRHHYEHDLQLPLASATLVDTGVAVAASENRQKSYESSQTFFGEQVSVLRPVRLPMAAVESLTAPELLHKVREARDAMSQRDEKRIALYRQYETFDRKLALAQAAQALFEAGFKHVVPADFELAQSTLACANETAAFARMQLRQLEPALQRIDDASTTRLACALTLLLRTEDAGTQPLLDFDPRSLEVFRREASSLIPSLVALAGAWPHLQHITHLLMAGALVTANAAGSPDPKATDTRLTMIVDQVIALLRKTRASIGDAPAPNSDPRQPTRLVTWLGLESIRDVTNQAPSVVNAAISLQVEVIGRLCAVALEVEAAVDRRCS